LEVAITGVEGELVGEAEGGKQEEQLTLFFILSCM